MKALPYAAAFLALALLPLSPWATAAEPASEGTGSEEIVTRPKLRALPFKSVVYSVDAEGKSFRMGKKKIRLVYVTPETRFLRSDGSPAKVGDLTPGTEIRGSTRKRENGELEAVTVKIGPKMTAVQQPVREEEEDSDGGAGR
jgi:hypothetical protein